MIQEYKTVSQTSCVQIEEKKSRFIGCASCVQNLDEASGFLKQIQDKNKMATHNVYAYLVGANPSVARYSDDGEPSGTAGTPILEVLKTNDLSNVIVVVTRYFGGTLLGTGGLVRAYTKAALAALNEAVIIQKTLHSLYAIEIEYHLLGKLMHLIQKKYILKQTDYTENVVVSVYVQSPHSASFEDEIKDLTNGQALISFVTFEYL